MHQVTQQAFTDELSHIQKVAGVGSFLSKGFGTLSRLAGGKTTASKLMKGGKGAWKKGVKGTAAKTKGGKVRMKGGKPIYEGGGTWGGIKGVAGSPIGQAAGTAGAVGGAGYLGARATG